MNLPLTFNSGKSIAVDKCQACGNKNLHSIIFLGFMPPVNKLQAIGSNPNEQPSYPSQLLFCKKCKLVQIGLIVDPKILFPYEYPYTSGTTKILRDNFADLYKESSKILNLTKKDFVKDIGSNDGTLLENFKNNHRILGITPEKIGKDAIKKGVPTEITYFSKTVAKKVAAKYGKADLITAANVFAHMENIHEIIEGILLLLKPNGTFISESHYLLPLLKTVQYDTIYHEHLRYYSLESLSNLLKMHGLEIFHAKPIPSHGGSIRVYAARKGVKLINVSVKKLVNKERPFVSDLKRFSEFAKKTSQSKLGLLELLNQLKRKNKSIYGISAPSRATTLINYCGIDDKILDYVVEVNGSYKIGNYVPGTLIPIVEEKMLFTKQPDFALLLSWHIADELMPKLKKKGFKGDFILPLPTPKIIKNRTIKL